MFIHSLYDYMYLHWLIFLGKLQVPANQSVDLQIHFCFIYVPAIYPYNQKCKSILFSLFIVPV